MTAATIDPGVQATAPPVVRPQPRPRILSTELRKMFDTRSGLWLMISIAAAALLATAAVIAFAPDKEQTYSTFGTAVGFPMAVILPVIAILSVTSEWSQRSGLTTFTLVPHRGRVIAAKAVCSVAVGVVSMVLAFGIGALGNLVGPAISGADRVWDASLVDLANIVLANVLGLLVGFMLGVLIRNSAGAIVGYFVYSFVLPTLSAVLAGTQHWFRDVQPWVDFNYAQSALFNGSLTGEQWAHLGVTTLVWLVVPIAVGVRLVMRSEVK
jgi:ABC-type transport system involved in multi-copper enzyme maturation permease subunit